MIKYSLLLLFIFSFLGATAQKFNINNLPIEIDEVRMSEYTALPQFVSFKAGKQPSVRVLERWLKFNFQLPSLFSLTLVDKYNDELGYEHLKYYVTIAAHQVANCQILLHTKNNVIHSLNGEFFTQTTDAAVNYTASTALNFAMQALPAERYMWEEFDQEQRLKSNLNNPLASYYPQIITTWISPNNDHALPLQLAYKVAVYAAKPHFHKIIYLSANDASVLHIEEKIHTSDVLANAATKYSGSRTITTDSISSSLFRLQEVGRGGGIKTYNLQQTVVYSTTDFIDTDNNWLGTNAQKDEAARDAHWASEMTYDYYQSVFGRNSIDGSGFPLTNYVHFSTNYVNAFWDGYSMTYGDGNTSYQPLTSLDIGAHEISHGLTQYTAALEYANEPGALNESFSDCMAAAVEFYAKPPLTANWTIAEDIGVPFRSMSNPNAYGDPDTYLGANWYIGGADNGGVHTNSGVMNKWFYLLSIGESGTNDVGDVYSVSGIGITKAAKIIYRAMAYYMFASCQYTDARFYSIKAAIDLYGPNCNAPEVVATTNAWYAVNVGDSWNSTVAANFEANQTASCSAPSTFLFYNNSSNAGTYLWDFGDGTTSTAVDPIHTYTALGNYTVSLIASGGSCGNDVEVITNYITIDAAVPCLANMLPNGTAGTQTSCSGTLYDSGGSTNNYPDNSTSIITIAPTGAASVTINFISLNLENDYDFIYLYNGTSTASPSIGSFTGSTLPPSITATSGAVTIKLNSDPYVNGTGFELTWTCIPITTQPTTDFKAFYTQTCSGTIDFADLSTNAPSTWLWSFGDGNFSTLQHPNHTYSLAGTYTVSLTTNNAFGSDNETKTAYISIFKSAPILTVADTVCEAGSHNLQAAASGGVVYWFSNSTIATPLYVGTNYTTISSSSSTQYFVEERETPLPQHVGPPNNGFGTGGFISVTSQYVLFNVLKPLRLLSVQVYANMALNRTIQLLDNSGAILKDTTLFVNSGPSRLNLNWKLPVQNNLRLGVAATADMDRRNSGAAYPYELPGIITITGSSAGASFYYFFYDWEIQQETCISERSTCWAYVVPSPTPTINGASSACENSTQTYTVAPVAGASYVWSVFNGTIVSGCGSSDTSCTVSWGNITGTINCSVSVP